MVTNSYEIKCIGIKDKEVLTTFLNIGGKSLDTFRYFKSRDLDVLKYHITTCILFEDEKPVGYGHLDLENNTVWLGVAVAEGYLGRGYGTKIMKFLLLKASENNLVTISLSVDIENKVATKLYKNIGFEIIKNLTDKVYLMEYKINT